MPITPVILAADVTDATAATVTSITGLSAAIRANQMYWFEVHLLYTVNATTTGASFAVDAPGTPTIFSYNTHVPLSPTEGTDAFEEGAETADDGDTVTASSAYTAANYATVTGFIKTPTAGEIIARVDTEVTVASAVVVKAGSWMRVEER